METTTASLPLPQLPPKSASPFIERGGELVARPLFFSGSETRKVTGDLRSSVQRPERGDFLLPPVLEHRSPHLRQN